MGALAFLGEQVAFPPRSVGVGFVRDGMGGDFRDRDGAAAWEVAGKVLCASRNRRAPVPFHGTGCRPAPHRGTPRNQGFPQVANPLHRAARLSGGVQALPLPNGHAFAFGSR